MLPRLLTAPLLRRPLAQAPRINSRTALLVRSYKALGSRQHSPAREPRIQAGSSNSSPPPDIEKGTTTWGNLDLFAGVAAPVYAVQSVLDEGFAFSSGVTVEDGSGVFLWQNQCFKWRPAERSSEVEAGALKTGVLELENDVWGMLDVLHPRPELLIVGTGATGYMLSRKDRDRLTELGVQVETMDTNNAATYYNLLAQERPGQVAAAMMVCNFGAKK